MWVSGANAGRVNQNVVLILANCFGKYVRKGCRSVQGWNCKSGNREL